MSSLPAILSSLSPPNGSLKVVSLGEPAMVVSSEGLPVGEASSPLVAVLEAMSDGSREGIWRTSILTLLYSRLDGVRSRRRREEKNRVRVQFG